MTSDDGAEPGGARRDRWRKLVSRVAILSVALLLVTILGRVGRWSWVFELMSHFALQYVVAALVLSILALWARAWWWLFMALAALVINGALVVPLYFGYGATSKGVPMRVMSFNVNAANDRIEALQRYIEHSDVDVMLILEVTPRLHQELLWLEPRYKLLASEPRDDNFGIAMLSRIEGAQAELVRLPASRIPAVQARIPWGGRVWNMLGVHTLPPVSADLAVARNAALELAADWARQQSGPRIVLGDLNVSPYSPYFGRLMDQGQLRNSQRGFGVQPTWPQQSTLLWPARVAIDHALHDADVVTMLRTTGPALGSDHLPLILTLAQAK